ncbi:hypothetical protein [Phenylobacterium sp.]|uniref:hypothetical protein n=1 Tax=Phenylobacterium sp. TaxID=1871053 RepID=UPI003BAA54AD
MPANRTTTPTRRLAALASTFLASAAILATAPAAQAQELSSVNVSRAPTSEAISIRGKDVIVVRHEVRQAAGRVCRNAFLNHELEAFYIDWCSTASADKAMTRYRAIVKQNRLAGGEFAQLSTRIVLSAR